MGGRGDRQLRFWASFRGIDRLKSRYLGNRAPIRRSVTKVFAPS